MKKFFTLLALVLMSCVGAWAQTVEYLSMFDFCATAITTPGSTSIELVENGVTVSVSTPLATGLLSGSTEYTLSDANVTTLNDNVNSDVFTNDVAKTYISAGSKAATSDLTITISGLDASGTYNISLVSGLTFEGAGSWNSIKSDNTCKSSDPQLGAQAISVRALAAYTIIGMKANNEGKIVLTVDNTNGSHTAVINALAIAKAPIGHTETEISALQEKIDGVIAKTSVSAVGYPVYSNSAVTTLAEYVTVLGTPHVTAANYDAALAALNAVYAVTDVNLPKDGKAYRISAVHVNADGTIADHYYLYSTAEGQVTNSNTGILQPYSKFIAKRVGDGVVLVNELGNYLCWFDGNDGTKSYSTKGCNDTYSATHNVLTIEHANTTCSNRPASVTGLTDLQRFGLLQMSGLQKNGTSRQYFVSDHTNNDAKHFVSGSAGDKYYGATSHTFLFQFEEVENTNKVKLSNPNEGGTSGLDGKYVGTFSAPYNVELPANVVAYTAVINDAKTVVTFHELGNIVPKNVGVLVYKEGATENVDAVAVPAISTLDVQDNAFVAVVNGTIAAGKYVLGNGSNGVGFYARETESAVVKNKAYLEVPAGIRSFRFDFEEQTTSIDSLQGKQTTGVAFDLAGRRINANAKGISIVNGKKYIK